MKANLKGIGGYFLLSISILASGVIAGVSVISGAKIIAAAIEKKNFPGLEQAIVSSVAKLQSGAPSPLRRPQPGEKKVEGVGPGTNTVMGDKDAKVLLVEFSDFQCPFSKKFYRNVFPKLDKEYIQTGKVKFAYRDYPLQFHPFAMPAAVAARCAGKQNKYWEMFEALNAAPLLDNKNIEQCAANITLDMDQFNACLSDKNIKDAAEKDYREGIRLGVSGTPGFFINGRVVEGSVSYDVFKKIIDEEISKAQPAIQADPAAAANPEKPKSAGKKESPKTKK